MSRYLTEAEFADQLGATEDLVATWRRRHEWPHLRIGRTIRYTPDHIAVIEAMQTTKKPAPRTTVVELPVESSRSTRRKRT